MACSTTADQALACTGGSPLVWVAVAADRPTAIPSVAEMNRTATERFMGHFSLQEGAAMPAVEQFQCRGAGPRKSADSAGRGGWRGQPFARGGHALIVDPTSAGAKTNPRTP